MPRISQMVAIGVLQEKEGITLTIQTTR